jgi:ABC-type branched-subunit amino acid transport system ATPase component
VLTATGLKKSFGGVHAVRDVSLEVPPSTITALVGPNGSGKTTVLNLLSGAIKSDEGRIELDGRAIDKLPLAERARTGIARTFQHMALFDDSSAFDNVYVAALVASRGSSVLEFVGLARDRRRAKEARATTDELLEALGIIEHRGTKVSTLSYGLQRRVEIARALATKPSVLLLDEPTAGMNEAEAHDVGSTLTTIAGDGTAILLVEHNIGLVTELCSYATVLDAGAVIARGTPAEVTKHDGVIEAYLGAAA